MDVIVGSVVSETQVDLVDGRSAKGQMVVTRTWREAGQEKAECTIVLTIPEEDS